MTRMNCEEINQYLIVTPNSPTREIIRTAVVGLVDAHRAHAENQGAAGGKPSPAGVALERINDLIGELCERK